MRTRTGLGIALILLVIGGCDDPTQSVTDWARGWGGGSAAPADTGVSSAPAAQPKAATTPKTAAAPLPTVVPRGERTRQADAARQVLVPAGSFLMGRDEGPAHEAPQRRVTLTRDFWIDVHEVTVGQWQTCVDQEGCSASQASTVKERHACNWKAPRPDTHPMNCVGSVGAEAYCAWAGGVLPSEAQWEYAARGPDGRHWPRGKTPGCPDLVWSGSGGSCALRTTEPVGLRAHDISVFGVRDLGGNVREWTADWYVADAYQRLGDKDPIQTARTRHRTSRGGAFLDRTAQNLRTSFRHKSFSDVRQPHNGFRCIGGSVSPDKPGK